MRLTSIKLAGFKSFVDPTTLALGSNLTGVVGPNGCGKSNVIDAVRWVTGESSARQLRGEALEDVIFNGSKARKPVGRASVELKFDNSEGKLGGQYGAFGEISIKRELARDGGSRYFINATKARRRDVIDLFLGTGLGGRSNYAVIEQGAVNRLIEARPEDMRQVLEEAAGISKYKERRRETENRIRHTRENLDRLNDLIGEVAQRLAVLKRQAANAEKYKQFKADERRLRAELLALRWAAQNDQVERAERQLREHEQTLAEAVSAQRRARAQRDEQNAAQQTAVAAVQTQQVAFYDAQSKASRIAQALDHARQMHEMRERERGELSARMQALDKRDADDGAALAALADEREQARTEHRDASRRCETTRAALARAEQAAGDAERDWDEHNSAERNPVQQLDAERTRARYAREQVKQLHKRRAARAAEREQLGEDDDSLLAAADRDIAARAERLEADQQAVQAAGSEDDRLRQTIAEHESELGQLRTELGENRAGLASERKLQQSILREGDAGVRRWLDHHGQGDAPGIARRIKVRHGWQAAAEAALGGLLRGFVVDRLPASGGDWPDDTLTLVEADAAVPASTATGAPAGSLPLADGLEAPPAIRAAAGQVFVVEDLPRALAARSQLGAAQRLVTLDGCVIGPASLTTPPTQAAEQGVLEREERIARLAETVEVQQARLDERTRELETCREAQRRAHERRRELDQVIGEARRELEAARARQQGERMRAEQRRDRRAELDAELTDLATQIEAGEQDVSGLDRTVAELADAAERFSSARRQAQTALAGAREQRDRAREASETAASDLRALEARLSQLASQAEGIESRQQDTRTAREDVSQRLTVFEAETGAAPDQAPDEHEHERAREAQATAERELRAARETLKQCENTLQTQSQAAMAADQAVEAARERLQQARIEVETAGVRRDGVAEQLDELGRAPAEVLAQLSDEASVERWNSEIETTERRIQRLGAINLAAIEEHEAEAERERYLADQHSDLAQALETLETAIARIDRETRTRFKATFEQVDARFSQMFPELFGGGEAALELTEDDWLVTGIRVMARPPGKRNASIQMLSGGEKALTAVALLFALFELNPAPFCMLDEIDAPLDDANVARFCELVRRMSVRVQFIVITHNKLTMSLAEQLHGVTMAEPGVSRLVSVDIDQALDMAG